MNRKVVFGMVMLGMIPFASCDGNVGEFPQILATLGLTDPPTPDPEFFQVLVDPSPGSSGNKSNLELVLEVILQRVGERPGSELRLWMMAEQVEDTVLWATTRVSDPPGRGGPQAQAAYRLRWAENEQELLLHQSDSFFPRWRYRSSPIVESVSKIALAFVPGGRTHRLILLSDGRPVSPLVGDLECRPPTDLEAVAERIRQHGLLVPGSLAGVEVRFSFYGMGPVEQRRCRVSIEHERLLRNFWEKILKDAGATKVLFEVGSPVFPLNAKDSEED